MKNSKVHFLLLLAFFLLNGNSILKAVPCSYTQSGNLSSNITFASIISCDNGDVTLSNMNSNPAGQGKVTFNANVTLNSLDIAFASGNKPIEFIIPAGITVTIVGDLSFSGQADKDKFFTINGTLIVGGTMDLGDIQFEIDGTGTIDAGAITGAGDTTCSPGSGGTGSCPTITTDSCTDSGGGFCSDPGVSLPIELISFDAILVEANIVLSWTTASEINNDYFTLERSVDGLNYKTIASLPGAGNSSEILEYNFIERNPLFGKSYYRLKQTDFDGASETFAPIAVEFTSLVSGDLRFNNPVKPGDKVTIYTNADDSELLSVSVYSMLGEEIIQQEFSGVNYSFDLSADVKPGIYFVKVASVSSEQTGRLVVR